MQNNRDWEKSSFLAAYEEFLERYGKQYSRNYRSFDIVAELAAVDAFMAAEPKSASWNRRMAVDDFVGLAFSSSKMKSIIQKFGRDWTGREIRELVRKYFPAADILSIPYRTELYMAQRKP